MLKGWNRHTRTARNRKTAEAVAMITTRRMRRADMVMAILSGIDALRQADFT
jgi:hypothetical protein